MMQTLSPTPPRTPHLIGAAALYLLLFLSAAGALFPARATATEPSEKVVHREDSLYQFIIVIDNVEKNERYLANLEKSPLFQGGIKLDAPDKLLFEYTRMSFVGLAYLDQLPKSALLVGLGIGGMPRFAAKHFPETEISAVEIDPAVVKIAKEYFSFAETERLKVTVEDGRQFIKKAKKKYDVIFLDAYQGDTIPFHLTTREFLREVKAKLHGHGVLVANILAPGRNKFFTSMIRTYRSEFPHLAIFKGIESKNYIFVASDQTVAPEEVTKKATEIQESRQLGLDLAAISEEQLQSEVEDEGGEVLTDDFAPVNLYRHME